jgi:Fe-S cluster assembly ATPase SufC
MARKLNPNPYIQRLADFIRERMNTLEISTYEVARRTENAISHGTVHNLLKAKIQQPEVATLDAVARGINVDKNDLLAIIHGVSKPSEKANDACLVELPKEIWLAIEAKAVMEDRTPIQQLTNDLRKLYQSKNKK